MNEASQKESTVVSREGGGGGVRFTVDAALTGLLAGNNVCPIVQVFCQPSRSQITQTGGAANELPKLLAPAQVTMAFKFIPVSGRL